MSENNKTPYVVCEDLYKIYKIADLEVVALRGLDLTLERGEMVAVVGASGSGKTTLLNILAGYDSPSAGKVTVGDRDLVAMSGRDVEKYRRHEVGFIWQQTSRNLLPYLTVLENVDLPMMLTSKDPSERKERSEELVELVGLSHRSGHTPDRISGGEQQRAAIAVALANSPSLLLADEPTGELDDATAGEVLDLLGSINTELDTTLLIVTHDPDIVRKVDRAVRISDGRASSEIRKTDGFRPRPDSEDDVTATEEYALVDGTGRIQIPVEFLERVNITDRAKIRVVGDTVIIVAQEDQG